MAFFSIEKGKSRFPLIKVHLFISSQTKRLMETFLKSYYTMNDHFSNQFPDENFAVYLLRTVESSGLLYAAGGNFNNRDQK